MKRNRDLVNATSDSSSSSEDVTDRSPPGSTLEELLQNEMEEKAQRLAKNREHVRTCRARKKVMIQSLRDDIISLSEENQSIKTENEALNNKVQTLEAAILDHIRTVTPRNFQSTPLHAQLHNSEIGPSSFRPGSTNNSSLSQPNSSPLAASNPGLFEAYLSTLRQNVPAISRSQPNISSMLSQNPRSYESMMASINQRNASNSRPQTNTYTATPLDPVSRAQSMSSILSQSPRNYESFVASLNQGVVNNSRALNIPSTSSQGPTQSQNLSAISRPQSSISTGLSQNPGNYESLVASLNPGTNNSRVQTNTTSSTSHASTLGQSISAISCQQNNSSSTASALSQSPGNYTSLAASLNHGAANNYRMQTNTAPSQEANIPSQEAETQQHREPDQVGSNIFDQLMDSLSKK